MAVDNGPNPFKIASNKEQYHPLSEGAYKGSCAKIKKKQLPGSDLF